MLEVALDNLDALRFLVANTKIDIDALNDQGRRLGLAVGCSLMLRTTHTSIEDIYVSNIDQCILGSSCQLSSIVKFDRTLKKRPKARFLWPLPSESRTTR